MGAVGPRHTFTAQLSQIKNPNGLHVAAQTRSLFFVWRIMPKKTIGLKTDPETQALRIGIEEQILPPPPPPPPTTEGLALVAGWGAAYKVGADLHIGDHITVDFSHVPGVRALDVAIREIKGLNFGSGGPSGTPWGDSPFQGSIGSGDNFGNHISVDTASFGFDAAGWRAMQVLIESDHSVSWDGSAPWGGSPMNDGGMENLFYGFNAYKFVNQDAGTESVEVSIDTYLKNGFGYGKFATSGTVIIGDEFSANADSDVVSVPLVADILAPSGLAVMTMMWVEHAGWTGDDEQYWPHISDSTSNPANFAKGRVLSGTSIYYVPVPIGWPA